MNVHQSNMTQLISGPLQLAHGMNFQRLAAFQIFNWLLKHGTPN